MATTLTFNLSSFPGLKTQEGNEVLGYLDQDTKVPFTRKSVMVDIGGWFGQVRKGKVVIRATESVLKVLEEARVLYWINK